MKSTTEMLDRNQAGRTGDIRFESDIDLSLSNSSIGAAAFGKTDALEDAGWHLLLLRVPPGGTLYTERLCVREG